MFYLDRVDIWANVSRYSKKNNTTRIFSNFVFENT
jgi:hypothetical protein